jgi:hypothetical protein
MKQQATDHDGKSKTASGVDPDHYPEQNEVEEAEAWQIPGHSQIAERAFELWISRGCPEGSPEHDWHQAEEELRAATNSRNVVHETARKAGSVQN